MRRVPEIVLFAALATTFIPAHGLAQVPEHPPKPSPDGDWAYVSPGPQKCVEAGNIYLHRGALPGALSRFQEAIQDDPHYAPAYLGLGKVYERMGKKREALEAYRRYLDELPSAREASDAHEVQRAIARLQKQL